MKRRIEQFLFRQFRAIETQRHELNYLFWECTTRCNLNCLHCGSDCAKDSAHQETYIDTSLRKGDKINKEGDHTIAQYHRGR